VRSEAGQASVETVAVVPLVFFALSCVAMLLNPLGRRSEAAT